MITGRITKQGSPWLRWIFISSMCSHRDKI
ncbi:MAG: hypothetical protein AB7V56_07060 [Candidatus Nitrosocosmicus sp.]